MVDQNAQWHVRATTPKDAACVTRIINAYYERWVGKPLLTPEDLVADWGRPTLDLDHDSVVVCQADGECAGYAIIWDGAPYTRICLQCYVHPDHALQGIEAEISHWAGERAAKAAAQTADGQTVLWQERLVADGETLDAYLSLGYQRVRYSLQMGLAMGEPPLLASPLDEISIRPYRQGIEERAMIWAMTEAFRDHWGVVERPFDEELAEWMQWIEDNPTCDPDLLFVAVNGDEIVGTVFGQTGPADAPDSGWIFGLGVRRPWRRQGVAQSLLRAVLSRLYEKGIRAVSLVVDAENLTGATGLYDKVGMIVEQRLAILERPVRADCHCRAS